MTKDELIKARKDVNYILAYRTNPYVQGMIGESLHNIRDILDAQIKACDVPKIEGLGEALRDYDNNGSALMDYENTDVLAEAAIAYHKLTGGE